MTLPQLAKKISYWQDHPALKHLGIAHWRFTLMWQECCDDENPDYEVLATAYPHELYSDATLTFNKERFEDEDYEGDQDRYIVHELLHVAMRDYDNCVEDNNPFEPYVPPVVMVQWKNQVKREREAHVDALARVIVGLDNRRKEALAKK